MIDQTRKAPIGLFTVSLLVLALAIHYWPKPACEKLELELGSGFFMRWQPPELLLVRADKDPVSFTADSKQAACGLALSSLNNG